MKETTPEAIEEIKSLHCLATNLSDGMRIMKAGNLARPLKTYREIAPLEPELIGCDEYARAFVDWQVSRQVKKVNQLLWEQPDVLHDAQLYVRRQVWQLKLEQGKFDHPVAGMIAATVTLHRKYRSDVHEALNHAAKHNEDVKLLGQEMKDQLDEIVSARLLETTQRLNSTILTEMPALQAAVMRGMLEDKR